MGMDRRSRNITTAVGLGLVMAVPTTAAAATTTAPATTAVPAIAASATVTTSLVQAASQRQLREGQRGEDVRAWQGSLNDVVDAGFIGLPRLAEDGSFGPATREATVALQAYLGIERDGIVGPKTRGGISGLLDSRPGVEQPGSRQLRAGLRGEDVREWQVVVNRLVREGRLDWPSLAEDGSFGPRTTEATIAVQALLGVDRDGVVGPVTRDGVAGLLDS